MTMPEMTQYVGIDVSKAHLDVAVLPAGARVRVTNDAAGWAAVTTQVGTAVPTCVVLEATSTYHVGAWLALHAAGMAVTVVNPARTHAFAKSEGMRAKTDHHDARLLARFGQQKQPRPTTVPSATVRRLQALVGCREDVTRALITAKNQRSIADDATVIAVHQRRVDQLETEQRQLDATIDQLLATDAELIERRRLVRSVPGAGPVISAALVAGLPELGVFDRRAIASLAGVAPHPRDSGTTTGQRACVGGRRHVTKVLSQLAVTAVRCDPVMRAHYQQLRSRCRHKVAIIACARRLLGIINAMLRDGLTWQETEVGQGHFLPETA